MRSPLISTTCGFERAPPATHAPAQGRTAASCHTPATVNSPFNASIPVGGTTLAHGPLTLVPIAGGVRILGLGRDGTFQTATYVDHVLSTWTSLGGSGFTGSLSAVAMPDGTLQVFATNAGTVQTQRQTTSGFPGTWTTLPGITASGSPSAIMAPHRHQSERRVRLLHRPGHPRLG